MRFITQLAIGLIVFNAMLIMVSSFFPVTTIEDIPVDVINKTEYAQYSNSSSFNLDAWDIMFGSGTGGIFGLIIGLAIGGGLAWVTKSPVPIGACTFGGFIAGLFMGTWGTLETLGSFNAYVSTLISIIGLIVGILIAATIIEALMGQQGAD